MSTNPQNIEPEIIYSYSRAQALEDGELVDCSEWSSFEIGLLGGTKVPVALTRALFETIKNIPEGSGQDIKGRTKDVLFMASMAARRSREQRHAFRVIMTEGSRDKILELLMDIGPGDDGEPVITIGFPEDF